MLASVWLCCVGLLIGESPPVAQTAAPSTPKILLDTGSREWNQPRGGPAGTSCNDVAPITSSPVQAWKASFKSIEGEPVSWGGIVYAIASFPESKGRRLVAIDLKSGKPAAKPVPVPDGFAPILAVWQGMVALLGGNEMTFYSQRGDQMVLREKKIAGTWPSAPCVYEGFLFACESRHILHCIEMQSMKDIGWVAGGSGQPAAAPGEKDGEIAIASVGSAGSALVLETALVSGLSTKAFKMSAREGDTGGLLDSSAPNLTSAYVAYLPPVSGTADDPWFVFSPERILAQGKVVCHTVMWGTHHLSPIDGQAAVYKDLACGFAGDGALISFFRSGKHVRVIPEGAALPVGARPGPTTIARGVIYLGNWAVELESSHVLWCDPAIEASTGLLPVADGTIVYATAKGELVCLKDPKLAPSAVPSPAVANAPKVSKAKEPKPSPPGNGDGIVLANGKRIAGKVTHLEHGRMSVTPAKGDTVEVDESKIVLVEDGANVRLLGAEEPVFVAFWNVLRDEWVDGLQRCFEEFRDYGFLDECQRLLLQARDSGMEEARAVELARSLTGKTSNRHDNADKQRAKVRGDEEKIRERSTAACVHAAEWCREHALPTAASVLLSRAEHIRPGQKLVSEKAAALIPRGFPDAGSADAPLRWMQLAEAILPVSGEVVPPGDADWERVKKAPWDQGAFGVRTANVLLFSREGDARIVGDCLRHGERTVRVLQGLLGQAPSSKADASVTARLDVLGQGPGSKPGASVTRRLDVRLHKNRDEYFAELGSNAKAMEWTAGYYSPSEDVARFYVPRDEKNHDPLDRGLEHVLIHELTHQYIADRWLGDAKHSVSGDVLRSGFWIVEGFARFIEDQVAEMDRRGERFDDMTVTSLDAACRVSAAGKLFPLDQYLDFSQKRFHELGDKPLAEVQLRNTIARIRVSEKIIFYEEGGSLVFYLMNEAGPEKRAALIEYMRSWYESRLERRSWESLGYASSSDLEKAFMGFLSEVAQH